MSEFDVQEAERIYAFYAQQGLQEITTARLARAVMDLSKKISYERMASVRVQSVGRQLLQDVKILKECIDRLRDGWRPGRAQGEWEHTDPGYLPEPMTPEQSEMMNR